MLCCIFNYAPIYRLSIYKKLSIEFNAHFYFNDKLNNGENIQKFDYNELEGFQKELKVHFFNKFEWVSYWLRLAFSRKYQTFLITPNPMAINQWLFLIICKLLGKRTFAWQHGVKDINISYKELILLKVFNHLLSGSFLYGHKAKQNMKVLGFNHQKLHVIYNSLDYDKSLQIRNSLKASEIYKNHFNNEYPVLLFIGRLTKVKKLEMIIHSQHYLLNKGIKTNVVIIGDGPEIQALKKIIKSLNLTDHYWFVGSLFNEWDIANYIFNAKLCVSPGNVGLTAIHSLSYGLPVVTNDHFSRQMPEHEAIQDGFTGSFFRDNDLKHLSECIEYWLSPNVDRESIRNNCYRIIDSKYNTNIQIGILKQVILNY